MYYVAENAAQHVFDGENVSITSLLSANGGIISNGNVGILTNSPKATLDVAGLARFGGLGLGYTMHGNGNYTAPCV